MLTGDPNSKVKGLNEFPKDTHPPVFITFTTYHIMIALGSLFAFISFIGIYLIRKRRLFETKWFIKLLLITSPLPLVANEA